MARFSKEPVKMRLAWPAGHSWPATYRGKRLPLNALVTTGTLVVPQDIPRGDLALMEQEFRRELWPPCLGRGLVRLARQFAWAENGRVLHYCIIDVPYKRKSKKQ
jgi:hypothetical protein